MRDSNTRIYKYKIDVLDRQIIKMPRVERFLSVGEQDDDLYIWAQVDSRPDAKLHDLILEIIGTGRPILELGIDDEFRQRVYIGTVQTRQGWVWHVFHLR